MGSLSSKICGKHVNKNSAEWRLMYGSIRGLFNKTLTSVVYRCSNCFSLLKTITTLVNINYVVKVLLN